ncbi:MAG TPA: serine hydrolase domain-containing protein [Allosphingosinicella sp.]
MTRLRNCLYICLLALGAMSAGPALAASPPSPAALEALVDEYLSPVLRTNNFSGVVAVARGDEIQFQKGYGYASQELRVPHRPETLFHIASISKPFTAAAILRLAERGALDLHAPLSGVLPGYPNGDVLTIHHLLTHTSGIPNINAFPEYDQIQYRPHTPEQLVAYFRDRPLEFTPGERYSYSNSNYNLLAHIIERVSGSTYGDFIRREIAVPFGLRSTGHPTDPGQIVPGLATGYAPRDMIDLELARYLDWSVKTGNGSLYSSAADILRFSRALHTGRLLGPSSLAASFTQHSPNVGYGWFITRANNRDIHHINGRSPGWAGQYDYYIDEGVSVIVLSNSASSVTTPIARAVGAMFFGEPHEPFPNLTATLPSETVPPLLGSYRFGTDYYVPGAVVNAIERGGALYLETQGVAPPSALIPAGPNRFIWRPYWSEVEFVPGSDGRASELVIDSFRGARVR